MSRIRGGMNVHAPPSPVDRLNVATQLWCEATGRSRGALASIVANDGKFFTRLDSPDATTTVAMLQRFARFLGDPANWPEGEDGHRSVPEEVAAFVHVTGVSPATPDPATGQSGELSGDIPDQRGGGVTPRFALSLDSSSMRRALDALIELAPSLPQVRDPVLRLLESHAELAEIDYGVATARAGEIVFALKPSEPFLECVAAIRALEGNESLVVEYAAHSWPILSVGGCIPTVTELPVAGNGGGQGGVLRDGSSTSSAPPQDERGNS